MEIFWNFILGALAILGLLLITILVVEVACESYKMKKRMGGQDALQNKKK